jgi:hypothetical protein
MEATTKIKDEAGDVCIPHLLASKVGAVTE